MKYIRLLPAWLLGLLSVGALSLTSCVRETETDTRLPLSFVDASQTRATQTGTFDRGDAIGIFVCKKGETAPYAINKKYIYDGQSFKPASSSDVLMNGGDEPDIYTYYPYSQNNNDITKIACEVKSQTTENDWKQSDFLTASHKGRIINDVVPLNFKHRYATVEVNVLQPDGVNSLVLKGIKYKSSCSLISNKMTVLPDKKDIALCPGAAASNQLKFCCTIPADMLFSSDNLELKYPGGNVYKFKNSSPVQLMEGKIHRFTADMGMKEVQYVFETNPASDVTVNAGTASGNKKIAIVSEKRYVKGGKDKTEKLQFDVTGTIPAWVHVTKDAQGNLSVSWDENKGQGRTAEIRIKQSVSDKELTIRIVQTEGKVETKYSEWKTVNVSIEGNKLNVPAIGGQCKVTATAIQKRTVEKLVNGKVVESKEEERPLDVSKDLKIVRTSGEGTVSGNVITIPENTKREPRNNVFKASVGTYSSTVTIRQDGAMIEEKTGNWTVTGIEVKASPSTIAATGGSSTITVVTHKSRTITTVINGTPKGTRTENGPDDEVNNGFTIDRISGEGTVNGTSISFGPNTSEDKRTSTFRVTYGGKTRDVTITQSGAKKTYEYTFELSNGEKDDDYFTETSLQESHEFIIKSTCIPSVNGKKGSVEQVGFTHKTDKSWIHVNGAKITVDNNPTSKKRYGTVTFIQNGSNYTITINVVQKEKYNVDVEN